VIPITKNVEARRHVHRRVQNGRRSQCRGRESVFSRAWRGSFGHCVQSNRLRTRSRPSVTKSLARRWPAAYLRDWPQLLKVVTPRHSQWANSSSNAPRQADHPANGTTMTSTCSRMGPWLAASLLFTDLGSRQGYQSESLGAPQAGPSRRDQNRESSPSCATQPLASMDCSRLVCHRRRWRRAVCSRRV
jgi:hypothetical protein